MTPEEKDQYTKKMLQNPEALQFILTVFYMILMVVVSSVEITGVVLTPATVMQGTDLEHNFEYWEVALFSVLFVFSLFFLIGCYRQLVRKAKKMEVFNKSNQKSLFNKFSHILSLMSFYLIFSWLAFVVWSLLAFKTTRWFEFITFGILGSGSVLCLARAYVYFTLNDFEYF
jgi:hypothetical protein